MNRQNIILITVDCLRHDYIGVNQGDKTHMSFTKALAEKSTVFTNCITAADGTGPSIASLLTSNYPPVHGQTQNGTVFDPKAIATLPEQLGKTGYHTCGAVAVEHLDGHFGYSRGFARYFNNSPWDRLFHSITKARYLPRKARTFAAKLNQLPRFGGHCADGEKVLKRVTGWMKGNKTYPFFLWVHFFDAHQHHGNAHAYEQRLVKVDSLICELVQQIEGMRLMDNTYFLITSDHGESFGEHGYLTHGMRLHDEVIKVPLIIVGPKIPPQKISSQVRTIDIAPTICSLAGTSQPKRWMGESLISWIQGKRADDLDALCYGACPYRTFTKCIRTSEWKYIIYLFVDHSLNEKYMVSQEKRSEISGFNDGSIDELYNFRQDPDERENLIKHLPEKIRELQARFFELENAKSPTSTTIDDDNIIGMLSALGYI